MVLSRECWNRMYREWDQHCEIELTFAYQTLNEYVKYTKLSLLRLLQ